MANKNTLALKTLPTKLDRYPAKMVTHLADRLLDKYASDCSHLLDPFCGSGAILTTAQKKGIPVTGIDINPYAILLTNVKLQGFDINEASETCVDLINIAKNSSNILPITFPQKSYWFTKGTIEKYERLRYAAASLNLKRSRAGRAILLALALSVRRCSRADQRSPKPFISKEAIATRKGKHFDPYLETKDLLGGLIKLHGGINKMKNSVLRLNIAERNEQLSQNFTHIITSPPYINAQDYYRNSKLELFILENLLTFEMNKIQENFIGTERGSLIYGIQEEELEKHYSLVPGLKKLSKSLPRHSNIIHRYLWDMSKAFDNLKKYLQPNGTCIIVCGDNLIGGYRIRTWEILNNLLIDRGFILFDLFTDSIAQRMLPPKRVGHKGIIKEEVISAFHLN